MALTTQRVAARPRDYVGVRGPDAARFLQAMLSNDVEGLDVGSACEALLLTPKARVIAPVVALRRGVDDFLLLTERGLGERLRAALVRSRFAMKCDVQPERHASHVLFDGGAEGIPTREYGQPAVEVLDAGLEPTVGEDELERLRIAAGTPRYGHEIDDRVLPAEAGLDARAIDFAKGCYPGQEPVARQRYRGRVNRTLRVLRLEGDELPAYDAEVVHGGKVVGRITSAARDGDGVVALGYVRREVAADAELHVGSRAARQLEFGSLRP